MSEIKKIAIIGAGASGLMAAIIAVKEGTEVHLYEQNTKAAKKILASGNGRCNITNTHTSSQDYFGNNPSFVDYSLETFGFSQIQKFCKNMGLLFNVLDDGRAYPLSNEARSVALSFESFALSKGVRFFTDSRINRIEKKGRKFTLFHENLSSEAYDKVLISTGSEAAPQLGGSTSGYTLALSFGHSLIPTYPSLVQLHLNSKVHDKMAGSKIDGAATLYINGKKEQSIHGDLLFTKYGISGFAILDISQQASQSILNYQSVDIGLDLLPKFDRQALSSLLLSMCQNLPHFEIETILSGMLPIKVAHYLLEETKINPNTLASHIHTKMTKQIVSKIKDWRFEVCETHGFKHAEVSGGGINTDEVNEKTMESKLCEGLYFAGEILDIVGRRGGFNFAFAFASGFIAGKELS